MKKKRKLALSREKHKELWAQVDNEGFGYYMLHYGPDLEAIEKLGFNQKKVRDAINLFTEIEEEISKGESYFDDEFED